MYYSPAQLPGSNDERDELVGIRKGRRRGPSSVASAPAVANSTESESSSA